MKLHNITLKQGSQRVLDSVNLEIVPSSIVSIMGESGSGKTTLLRVLAGLEKQTEGSYERTCTDKVGMVFQQLHLFPHIPLLSK